jgi:DNA-binding NarL/FixJ family response regulator
MSSPRHFIHPQSDVLTEREMEVMSAFRKGESYKAIAQRFGISFCTVRNYLFKAREKQGTSRGIV